MATPVIPGFPRFSTPPGPIDAEQIQRQFWEIIDEIDRFTDNYRLPVPHLRPVLEQFSLIDSKLLCDIGENVWGTGGTHPGIPQKLKDELMDRVPDAVVHAAIRWHGPAFNQFKGYMDDLVATVRKFSEPAQQVGELLVDLAEKFKLSWLGIIGLIAEVAGLVLAIAGMGLIPIPEPVATKVSAAIIEVVGLILAIIGMIITLIDELWPRIQAAKGALDQLKNEINQKIPLTVDARVPIPTGQWQRNTEDPTN